MQFPQNWKDRIIKAVELADRTALASLERVVAVADVLALCATSESLRTILSGSTDRLRRVILNKIAVFPSQAQNSGINGTDAAPLLFWCHFLEQALRARLAARM